MNRDKLNQLIFSQNFKVYTVLDGASIPDLRMQLYEMRPQHLCLYRGELEPDIAEVAPYLVRIGPDTKFTNWIFTKGWGKHWGIFAQTKYSIYEVRKHFRRFLTVYDEDAKPMLFRYYDPRVLRNFLPTCNAEELNSFFKVVSNYLMEDEETTELLSCSLQNGELKLVKTSID